MRSETTWYAFDETEFDNKEECEEYEKKTLDMINSVIFFDHDMNQIKNPTIGDIESLAFYMVIKDAKKAKELFDYLPRYISFETPRFGYENGDKFEFDEDAEEWHDDRYFWQCYYNLEEKYDCGGIHEKEWNRLCDICCEERL